MSKFNTEQIEVGTSGGKIQNIKFYKFLFHDSVSFRRSNHVNKIPKKFIKIVMYDT